MKHVTRTAIALTTAVTLAVPAQAENDAAKVLAGLLGVAILGAVISDIADDNHTQTYAPPPPPPTNQGYHHGTQHYVKPRPLPPQVQRYVLPRHCARKLGENRNGQTVLVSACLSQHYPYARDLPRKCTIKVWNGQNTKVSNTYGLGCLQRYGYRIAGQ